MPAPLGHAKEYSPICREAAHSAMSQAHGNWSMAKMADEHLGNHGLDFELEKKKNAVDQLDMASWGHEDRHG